MWEHLDKREGALPTQRLGQEVPARVRDRKQRAQGVGREASQVLHQGFTLGGDEPGAVRAPREVHHAGGLVRPAVEIDEMPITGAPGMQARRPQQQLRPTSHYGVIVYQVFAALIPCPGNIQRETIAIPVQHLAELAAGSVSRLEVRVINLTDEVLFPRGEQRECIVRESVVSPQPLKGGKDGPHVQPGNVPPECLLGEVQASARPGGLACGQHPEQLQAFVQVWADRRVVPASRMQSSLRAGEYVWWWELGDAGADHAEQGAEAVPIAVARLPALRIEVQVRREDAQLRVTKPRPQPPQALAQRASR